MKSYRFIIKGKVQGVFYRKSVSAKLSELDICGYVRNLEDGTVEVVAKIEDDKLNRVKEILLEGSPRSEVEDIVIETLNSQIDCSGFEIRY